eukprot:359425-Chlamydomonas_euryale.AAC.7
MDGDVACSRFSSTPWELQCLCHVHPRVHPALSHPPRVPHQGNSAVRAVGQLIWLFCEAPSFESIWVTVSMTSSANGDVRNSNSSIRTGCHWRCCASAP